jgi:hypothetical protein
VDKNVYNLEMVQLLKESEIIYSKKFYRIGSWFTTAVVIDVVFTGVATEIASAYG